MGYIVYYGKCNSLKIPRERSRIGSNPITRTKQNGSLRAPVLFGVRIVRDREIAPEAGGFRADKIVLLERTLKNSKKLLISIVD